MNPATLGCLGYCVSFSICNYACLNGLGIFVFIYVMFVIMSNNNGSGAPNWFLGCSIPAIPSLFLHHISLIL